MCEWLFDTVAGIRVDGMNHFIIAPHCGGTLTYAKSYYESIYGRVESSWQIEKGVMTIKVSIPCNTTAEVILPNAKIQCKQWEL